MKCLALVRIRQVQRKLFMIIGIMVHDCPGHDN